MPLQLEQLKLTSDEKEQEVIRCTKTAKVEVRRLHQKRLMEMRDSMVQYTEGQIRCAKEAYDKLEFGIEKIREFPLPQGVTWQGCDTNNHQGQNGASKV